MTASPPTARLPLSRTASGVARAAIAIAIVTAAARVVGLLRTTVMAATVGDSAFVGNTYGTANTLPNIVFEIVAGGALAGLVVPVLAGAVGRGDVEHVRAAASAMLTWTVVLLVPVTVAGILLARPLMTLLTVGVDDPALRSAEVDLGARMLVVFMPQVVLYGIGIVLAGVLQSHRRFLGPAVAPLVSSLVVITAYLVYAGTRGSGRPGEVSRAEELVLSIGTTLGVVALSMSLLVPVVRLGVRLRPTLRMPAGVGPQVRRLAAAGGAGVVAQQVAILVALLIVNAQPGAVVAYQLAYTVFLLPWGVLAVPLATSAFPELAASAESGRLADYRDTLASAVRVMVLICTGAAAILWAVRVPLVSLLPFEPVGSGAAGATATRVDVSDAVGAMVVGLPAYGLLALLTRALFARGRSLAAATATVAGFGTAAAVSAAVAQWTELSPVTAVSAGHSVGMVVAAVLLLIGVRRDAGPTALSGASRSGVVALIGGVLAAVGGSRVAGALGGGGDAEPGGGAAVATVILAALVAGGLYVGGLAGGAVPELGRAIAAVRERVRHE